jgi:hypothetical protein
VGHNSAETVHDPEKRTAFRGLILFLIVLFSLVASAANASECERYRPLGDLSWQMRQGPLNGSYPTPASARYISDSMNNINMLDVERSLRQAELSLYYPSVEALVAHAETYVSRGYVEDQSGLEESITHTEKIMQKLCAVELENISNSSEESGRAVGFIEGLIEGRGNWVRASLVGLGAILVIGLFLGSVTVARYVIGLLQHRKTCQIEAILIGNGEEFQGELTRAALHAVRFQPANSAEAARLVNLMESPGFTYFDLRIRQKQWPVFVDGYHGSYAPIYFFARLSRRELSDLLSHSTLPIQSAPYIGHRSTRKKWKDQIASRKQNIKQAQAARADL